MKNKVIAAAALYLALVGFAAVSEARSRVPDTPPTTRIDAAERRQAVDAIRKLVRSEYVFPEVAVKIDNAIQAHAAHKDYDQITDGQELAEILTRDLQEVSHDRHLRVSYSPTVLPPESGTPMMPTKDEMEQMRRHFAEENFGFSKVEILRGNVGYLKIDYFISPEWMGDTLRAAMDYLGNTDALIIDIRANGGSMHMDAVPLVCSYFFDKPTHINSIYWKPENKTTDFYTKASVPGRHYGNKPIYVLTSGRTFSGAEEFAYDLQNQKRAILIGETTGGGANGGGDRRATDHFQVWIPVGRAINPITKTNWEGVGVKPEVPVPAFRALHTAHLAALSGLIAVETDAERKAHLTEVRASVEKAPPLSVTATFTLSGHKDAKAVYLAGDFNGWSNHSLPMTRKGEGWVATVETEPGRHEYKFVVDGRWMTDPTNQETAGEGRYTNSVRVLR